VDRTLSLVAAQVRPIGSDPDATFDKFAGEVRTIARSFPETNLVIFPELYLAAEDPFVAPGSNPKELAEPIPGPLTERVAKVAESARRFVLAGSIYERDGDAVYNTAIVFAPDGELIAHHRKIFPWRPWETVAAGDEPTIFDIPGVGRFGLMICYDGWFQEVPRLLMRLGAEVILQPSLTTTPDREEELVLARAAAIVNQCYVVNVNAASTLGGGRSVGVDPEGRVLFEAATGEELITEVIDLDRVTQVRQHGTRGLNRVLEHLEEAPLRFWDVYRSSLPNREDG
jgi:predicted amidohydrolase